LAVSGYFVMLLNGNGLHANPGNFNILAIQIIDLTKQTHMSD